MKIEATVIKWAIIASYLNLMLFSNTSFGYPIEDIDNIKSTVKNFVSDTIALNPDENMEVQFDQVSALSVAKCQGTMAASLPKDNLNKQDITAVELTCHADQSWHVYIPVHVIISTKVLVAKQTIPAHEPITEDNVELAYYDKNRLYSGFYKSANEVNGLEAVQLIQPGTVLTKKNIQAPIIVHRNQVIDISATRNSVSVSMKAIAKSDGAISSTIQVYNPSSKKTIDAIVVGPNRAEIL